MIKFLGMDNVHCHLGDGSLGWSEAAPYHGILIAAAAPKAPEELLDQLIDGGRMILPIGKRGLQTLELFEKIGEKVKTKTITAVAFVPLMGEKGWSRKAW